MSETAVKFCTKKAKDIDFQPIPGFREWLIAGDLGLKEATNGAYTAWITRANQLAEEHGTTGRHYHDYDFQIMYITKGWVKMYYEGQGDVLLEAGDFVYHPKAIVHDFMEYSDDIEIFELVSPGTHHYFQVEEESEK